MDDGLLRLDDPASKFFPTYYTGQKGTMTFPPRCSVPPPVCSVMQRAMRSPGRSYTWESSGDLAAGMNLFDLPGTNGWWEIPLSIPDALRQFFRAKLLP